MADSPKMVDWDSGSLIMENSPCWTLLDDFCWMIFQKKLDKRAELCQALPKMSRRMNVEEHQQLKPVEITNFLSIAWFPKKLSWRTIQISF